MWRMIAASALLFAIAVLVPAQGKGAESGEAAVEAAVVEWLLQSAYGPARVCLDGASGKCGSTAFKFMRDKKSGDLMLVAGSSRQVVPPEGATLELPSRKRLAIYPDDAGELYWFAADAVRTSIDGLNLLFIDGNHNGKYTDVGHDFIAVGPRGAYAFPVAKTVPLIDYSYSFQEGRDGLRYTRTAFTTQGKARELQNALNQVRMDFGLFPAASKPEWDAAAQAHCEYMHKNGKMTHFQDAKADGYSKEGDQAARTSNLTAKNTPVGAVKLWLGQPLHGRQIRATWLTISGFGFHEGYACLRVTDLSAPEMPVEQFVAFPPNGARDVPVAWAPHESPEPRLDAEKDPGYPITFSFGWGNDVFPRALKAKLERRGNDGWVEVPAQVSYGSNNAPSALARMKYAFVLPVTQLEPDTVYRISGEAVVDRATANFSSTFRTGRATNARAWDTTQQR